MSDKLNKVGALRAFFDVPPLKMEELKSLPTQDRAELAELAKAEMVRRGGHAPEDFDF